MNYTTKDEEKKENFLDLTADTKKKNNKSDEKIHIKLLKDLFLKKFKVINDSNNSYYLYNGKYWEDILKETLIKLTQRVDNEWHSTGKRRNETFGLVSGDTLRYNVKWNNLEKGDIPFSNGIYNLITEQIKPLDSELYLNYNIPHEIDMSAECPFWEKCLDDWLETKEQKECLMQFIGYTLSLDNNFKKAMFLLGESDTGKSKICEILTYILGGPSKISSIPINKYDESRSLAPIKGKKANITTEISSTAVLAEEGFKKITSGDAFEIDPKNVKPSTIIPIAKMWFASNNLFKVNDKSNGVWRRMIILKFNKVIPLEKQDGQLFEKLKKEVKGIIAYAIKEYRKTYQTNKLTIPKECQDTINEMKSENSIILDFILNSEYYEITGDYKDKVDTIVFRKYLNIWSEKINESRWIFKELRKISFCKLMKSNSKYYIHNIKEKPINHHLKMMVDLKEEYVNKEENIF